MVTFLALIVFVNAFLVRERDHIWEATGREYSTEFQSLLGYRGQIREGSQIGIINFTGAAGFLTPMIKVCLDVNDVTLLNPVPIEMIDNMEVLRKAEKSFLFIHTRAGQVYNKTPEFRNQLLLNRMALLNPEHPEYKSECQVISTRLLLEINTMVNSEFR
jgi:hypothetical protein